MVTNFFLYMLAIYGLAFFVKEMDGPFDLMSKIRHKLIINKRFGPFFYKLFSCYFCVGFHCGWIVYLLSQVHFIILWGLAGAAGSLILDAALTRLLPSA